MDFNLHKRGMRWFTLLCILGFGALGCGSDSGVEEGAFLLTTTPGAPTVANGDTFTALGNTPLNVVVAQSVLVNDTGDNATITDNTVPANGTLNFNRNDGTFVYTPTAGFRGPTDTFTYTLSGSNGTSVATVTINFGTFVVYVDNSAAGPGDGSFGNRFTTLAQAQANSQVGDTIFVFNGTGAAYGGGITLANNQSLVGEVSGFNFENQPRIETVVGVGPRPTITNGAGNGVTLADGNTVQGLAINNVQGSAIAGTGNNGGTVSDVTINTTTVEGIVLTNSTGTFSFNNVTANAAAGRGVELAGNGGGTFNFDNLTITNAGFQGFRCSSLDNGTVNLRNSRIETTGNDGMRVASGDNVTVNVTGTTITDVNNTCFSATADTGGVFNITLGGDGAGNANTLTNPGDGCVFYRGNANTSTFRIINTSFASGARNANATGVFLPITGTHQLNYMFRDNQVAMGNAASHQLLLGNATGANVRFTGNTFTNNHGGFGTISNNSSGTVCAVMTGNTFTNTPFVDSNGVGSTFNIEPQVNNNPAITEGTNVTQVGAGTCPPFPN